jgi:hypothetical protein
MSQQWPPQQPSQGQPYEPYGQQPGQYGQYGPPTQPGQYSQQQWQQGQPGGPGYQQPPNPLPYGGAPYPQGYPAPGSGAPPPYGMPPAPQQPRSRAGLIMGIIVILAVLAGGTAFAVTRLGGKTTAATGTPTVTTTTGPTATPTVAVIYTSPLFGNVAGWPSRDGCSPQSDGYHVKADVSCFAPTSAISNFSMTVTGQAVGTDTSQPYGVTFRSAQAANDQIGDTYVFLIANDGSWALAKLISGSTISLGKSTTASGAIHPDGSANIISVVANGSHITVSVNGTQITAIDDSSLSSGFVGLQGFDGGEAIFTDLTITKM